MRLEGACIAAPQMFTAKADAKIISLICKPIRAYG
jgi:hypothetical protein